MGSRSGAARMAAAAAVIGALVLGCLLTTTHGDPLVVAALGDDGSIITPHVAEVLHREVATRPGPGHDGQAFLLQAWDPLYVGRDHIAYVDRPVYRGQRMLYPLLAGLGGLAPAAAVPWLMLVTQWAALVVGTYATARLAQQLGARPGVGLAFVFSPAILAELSIGGAGIVALAAALMGTVALEDGRERRATVWLVAAALAREVMLLYVVGVALLRLVRRRRVPWLLGLAPLAAVGAWHEYLVWRLGHAPGDKVQEFDWPLRGLLSAPARWNGDAVQYVMAGVLMVVIVAFVVAFARRRPSYVGWGSAGFVVLAPLLSVNVWQNWFDIHRGVLPLFTAAVLLWATRGAPSRNPDPVSAQESSAPRREAAVAAPG